MLSAADADRIIGELILDSELRVLGALENSGHDQEALELWAAFLDDAETLTEAEIAKLRLLRDGDAVADTIIAIQCTHRLSLPVAAGGWRRLSRWATMLLSAGGGFIAVAAHSFPFGSLFAAAVGAASATIINWRWLGGRPERRHAVEALLTPRSQRLWKRVGEIVGPSPLTVALGRPEVGMVPGNV